MKKILILALFLSLNLFAQTDGISYQAVILNPDAKKIPGKNPDENILLLNKSLSVRFTITNGVGTSIFQEVHTTKTDAYGMINLVIGHGSSVSGVFTEIVWDGKEKNLIVEINLGGSYTLLSNQNLLYVPYAYHRDVIASGNLTVAGKVAFSSDLVVDGTTNLNKSLSVNNGSPTTLTGSLDVSEKTTLNDALTVANGSSTDLSGTLDVTGKTTLDNTLDVLGATTLKDNLTVANSKPTLLTGTLTANGITNLNNTLNVTNGSPANFSGDINVVRNQNLDGDLVVNGTTSLNKSLDVKNQSPTNLTGTLNVDGASDLNNTLTVDGATVLNNSLDVKNQSPTNLTGTLNVDGASDLNNTLTVDGATVLNNSLDVKNQSPTNLTGTLNIDGATDLNNTLTVDGATVLNNSLDVKNQSSTNLTGTLNVDRATDLNNTLTVDGATVLNNSLDVKNQSPANLTGTLNVDGATDLNNTLTVEGATVLNNSLDVKNQSPTNLTGTLNVDSATDLNNTLTVDGATDLNNTLTVDGATVLNNSLDVKNQSSTNLTGTLNVDGATDLNNTLIVDGATVLNNSLAVLNGSSTNLTGALNVDGATDLKNSLTVDGATVINNSLVVTGVVNLKSIVIEGLNIKEDNANFVATFENTNGGDGDGLKIKLGKTHGAWNNGSYLNITNPALGILSGPLDSVKKLIDGGGSLAPADLIKLVPAAYLAGGVVQIGNSIIDQINTQLGLPIGFPKVTFPETAISSDINIYSGGSYCLPRVHFPEKCIPRYCVLGVCTPEICTPEFWLPPFEICTPEIPGITIPGITIPSFTILDADPNFVPKIPNLPDFGLPTFTIPNVNFSVVTNSLTKGNEYISFQDKDDRLTGSIRAQSTKDFRDNTILDDVYVLNVVANFVGVDLLGGVVSGIVAMSNLVDGFNHIGVQYSSGNGDYAEWLERLDVDEYITSGDIVAVKGGKITKDLTDVEQIMVVSHKPIVLGNIPENGKNNLGNNVAFRGQVPVKVMGAVRSGDFIVANKGVKGYGLAIHPEDMKAADHVLAVGRSWENKPNLGPKVVNTVVGVTNGNWKINVDKIQQKQEILDLKILELESKLNKIAKKINNIKSIQNNYANKN